MVVHEFERHGWQVEAVYLGNPIRHDEMYLLINQGFAGKQRLMYVFQPLQQPRPYPCHPVGRRQPRAQWLPYGQVGRETRRIRRRSLRAPHRRLQRIQHSLHRLREIPRSRHRQCASKRHLITACCTLPCKTYDSAHQNNANCCAKEYLLMSKTMFPFRSNIVSSVSISARKLSFLPFFYLMQSNN